MDQSDQSGGKGEAENATVNTFRKLFQTFCPDTRDQQVSANNHSLITVIQSYDCKQTPVSLLYYEKMDDVVLLNVFTKGFSASPLSHDFLAMLNPPVFKIHPFANLPLYIARAF